MLCTDAIRDVEKTLLALKRVIRALKGVTVKKRAVNIPLTEQGINELIELIEVVIRETECTYTKAELALICEVDESVIEEIIKKRPDLMSE